MSSRSVCLSASIFAEIHVQLSPNFLFVRFTCDLDSILLWRSCETLYTSGFMDNIMFVHNGHE